MISICKPRPYQIRNSQLLSMQIVLHRILPGSMRNARNALFKCLFDWRQRLPDRHPYKDLTPPPPRPFIKCGFGNGYRGRFITAFYPSAGQQCIRKYAIIRARLRYHRLSVLLTPWTSVRGGSRKKFPLKFFKVAVEAPLRRIALRHKWIGLTKGKLSVTNKIPGTF